MNLPRPPPDDQIKELLRQAQRNVPGAEAELIKLLSPWVRGQVRKTLDPRVRRFEDSEDIMQEALMALVGIFKRQGGIKDPEKFLHFLKRIAHDKTVSANRRHLDSQKHQDGSEVDFSAEFSEEYQPLSPSPGPIQEAEAHETWDRLVESQPEPLKTILRMKVQGFSIKDIANQVRLAGRTVRKIVEFYRKKLPKDHHLNN